jgi:hypothetical protein
MKLQLHGQKLNGKWSIQFPDELREKIYKAFDKAHGRCELEIFDRKPRTTGELSQNHRVAYLCNAIAAEVNKPGVPRESYESVKLLAKFRAIKRGFPFDWINVTGPNGRTIKNVMPWSESKLDTVQCGILIDELEQMFAEATGGL